MLDQFQKWFSALPLLTQNNRENKDQVKIPKISFTVILWIYETATWQTPKNSSWVLSEVNRSRFILCLARILIASCSWGDSNEMKITSTSEIKYNFTLIMDIEIMLRKQFLCFCVCVCVWVCVCVHMYVYVRVHAHTLLYFSAVCQTAHSQHSILTLCCH